MFTKSFTLYNFAALAFMAVILSFLHIWVHQPPDLPKPPLKDLAAGHKLEIGNYASLKRLKDQQYTGILTSQYGFVTNDGELNWTFNDGSLRPAPDQYDFSNSDKVFKFAQSYNLPVQAHHLVWGEEKWLPMWLKNGNYNKQQLLDFIHQHIANVAGHYKGQVREWTVVNEAFSRGLHEHDLRDWWQDHTGDQEYIDQSFIWAHQADPTAKLLINDFNDEGPSEVTDALYNYIKGAKARGVPIDGVGMQMHIDAASAHSKSEVIDNMRHLASLGVEIYVTEFDVNLSNVSGNKMQRETKQATIYHDMLGACIESGVCHSFAELGITDKETWYNELGWINSKPLPFDENYKPKPAFFALRQALN